MSIYVIIYVTMYVPMYGDIWQCHLRATRKSFILGLSEKGRLRNILQLPTSAFSTFFQNSDFFGTVLALQLVAETALYLPNVQGVSKKRIFV